MGVDAVTWQALGLVLTVVGLVLSALVWKRRGVAAGTRAAAWSLLPLAAGLTGTLRLFAEIAEAVGRWAVRLVFSPVVWLGIIVAGASGALFVVSGLLRRRDPRQVDARPTRGIGRGNRSGEPAAGSVPAKGQPAEEDAEVEAILRRHGIG